ADGVARSDHHRLDDARHDRHRRGRETARGPRPGHGPGDPADREGARERSPPGGAAGHPRVSRETVQSARADREGRQSPLVREWAVSDGRSAEPPDAEQIERYARDLRELLDREKSQSEEVKRTASQLETLVGDLRGALDRQRRAESVASVLERE